jgi:hypothetical protein
MKGRCLLNPQPDTRGISKNVVYAMGNSFRTSRNVVDQVSTLARRVYQSVNRHPRRNCSHSMCSSQRVMPSFVWVTLVLISNHSSSLYVRFQALVEICRTPCAIDDCHDQQQKRDDSKCRQTFPRRFVILNSFWVARVVHAHEFEEKVSHSCEVEDDRAAHSQSRFASGKPCRRKQNGDGDGDGGDSESELDVGGMLANHDDELHRESKEEEKVELEQRNVNLLIISPCSARSLPNLTKSPGKRDNDASSASRPRCVCRLSRQIRRTASTPRN